MRKLTEKETEQVSGGAALNTFADPTVIKQTGSALNAQFGHGNGGAVSGGTGTLNVNSHVKA
jgi:hypothetical protein